MIHEIAESYFLSLNPLSERITRDISSIKAAYETLWVEMSGSEQDKIINDAIIFPSIKVKYSADYDTIDTKSTCRFSSGDKVICDDQTGLSWRDEHSAPFSWKSRSLLSLCESPKCVPPLASTDRTYFRKFSNTSTTQNEADQESKENHPETSSFGNFTNNLRSKLKTFTLDDNNFFLSKVKNGAVERLQNTFRLLSGKSTPCSNGESDRLVVHNQAVIVPKTEKDITIGFTPAEKELNGDTHHDQENIPATMSMLSNTPRGSVTDQDELPENEPEELDRSFGDAVVTKTGFDFLDDW